MKKYAIVVNNETKACNVGLGSNVEYYKSIGMTEQDVEQSWSGEWYIEGYAPAKPQPTIQEQVTALENEYQMNRWQREGILAQNSNYSQYTKDKAQEIEDLAEQLRHLTEGGNNE